MVKKTFLGLLGMLGLALLLELAFRILPVSSSTETGYYTDPLILTYPPKHRWTISTGWDLRNAQQLTANNLGYAAHRDFLPTPNAVALIGDSFVEASMLAASERPGAQLERALKSRPVFAMGGPGTSLLDYAERIRFAQTQLGVHDFVVLMERGDVKQALCGSGNVNGSCLDPATLAHRTETLPPPGIAKRVLRQSALAQYLFSQLKLSPQKLKSQMFASNHPVEPVETPPQDATEVTAIQAPTPLRGDLEVVINTFFERIKPHVTGKLVIVLDSDRAALYQNKSTTDHERTRFMTLARAAGAIVIDTDPLFRAHLAQSQLRLDVGPYDGHLNSLGVELVTQAAAAALKQE